jgi:hypothetical protein
MRWAIAVAAALPLAAAAQDRPPVLPTRDVDVTYQSKPGAIAIEQRSRFSAAMQRTRLDLPTPGLFSIMDYRSHTMSLVSVVDRKVLQTTGATTPATSDYVRRGQDQVAGLACTEWEVRDSVGQPALTCFTPDGVMLRARRGDQVLAVATRVIYAPQDAALFEVPSDFDRVQRRVAP